jgi:DNA-binding NarL/FixJ family response regulator
MINNPKGDSSFYKPPRIAILGEEHWFCIRRQYRMSPRELQVAKLVCRGFNNEEVAGQLKMKQGTVKTHIRNIYRRIQVKNKIEMLLKFVDNTVIFSGKWGINPPISIAKGEKAGDEPPAVFETPLA